MNTKNTTYKFCITAVCIALTYLATAIIQIPIPLGYAQLGDTIILLSAFLFGPWVACISGGIGSALADILTGYAIWALPTLLIKTLIPLIACVIMGLHNKKKKMLSIKTFLGAIASMLFMIVGYTFFGAILYGSVGAGLASTPGLLAEAVVNIIIFYCVGLILEKGGIHKILSF